jgi:peptidoglycan hydrolase-like protein with peptidoglycan-binding domain
MNKKSLVYVVLVCFAAASLTGCSSAQKKRDQEMQGIKTKVDTLESKVEGVESKLSETERALAAKEAEAQSAASSTVMESSSTGSKCTASVMEIQQALKNAGFYSGKVDGVKGKGTRKAIKGFQRANGLTPDGKVGPKTWDLLSRYAQGSGSGDVK